MRFNIAPTLRTVIVLVAVAVAAMSFAPFKDMRKNVKIEPERTETQRTIDQQQYQTVQGEIAPAPVDSDTLSDVKLESANPDGNEALMAAQEQSGDPDEAKIAKDTLIEAERQIQLRKGGGFNWILAAILGALGGGIFFGVRHYAAKSIPEMPDFSKKSKW